jgi:Methyltransferase domain
MASVDVLDAWKALDEGKAIIKWSNCPAAQQRHFARFQGLPITVLEVGVAWGGSLRLWRHYFGEQATIIGVDIYPECQSHESERIHIEIGDQADAAFLSELADRLGPFDIVMDDGGHAMAQQIITFQTLFPRVKDGGVYQCEDVNSSYMLDQHPPFGPPFGEHGTFIQLMKSKIDEMFAWFVEEPTAFTRSAASMHIYPGTVFIEKEIVDEPQFLLGGNGEIIYASMKDVRGY